MLKKGDKSVIITAYDALFARLFAPHADMILVGDSLAMSFYGKKDTLAIGMNEMIYHTKAVGNGAPKANIIFDMPFGSDVTPDIAVSNALRAYKETDACCVKLEGGQDKEAVIRALTREKIAVMAHIGLTPQSVRLEGGYKIKGKTAAEADMLMRDAKAVEAAGAFSVVLEGVKSDVASEITKELSIPTIGIGSGAGCDGQVLVWSDMLGLFQEFTPKFVRKYLDGASLVETAMTQYRTDVQSGDFPNKQESY